MTGSKPAQGVPSLPKPGPGPPKSPQMTNRFIEMTNGKMMSPAPEEIISVTTEPYWIDVPPGDGNLISFAGFITGLRQDVKGAVLLMVKLISRSQENITAETLKGTGLRLSQRFGPFAYIQADNTETDAFLVQFTIPPTMRLRRMSVRLWNSDGPIDLFGLFVTRTGEALATLERTDGELTKKADTELVTERPVTVQGDKKPAPTAPVAPPAARPAATMPVPAPAVTRPLAEPSQPAAKPAADKEEEAPARPPAAAVARAEVAPLTKDVSRQLRCQKSLTCCRSTRSSLSSALRFRC